jgi:hypothetical protein
MNERIAKIESTMLGREDHGIWTAFLFVSYGGSSQGIGGYCFDGPIHDDDGKFLRRAGGAFGMEWIMRATEACGVDSWEEMRGRTILVYFEDDGFFSPPIGIGPLPTEPGKPFMFADLTAEYIEATA